MTSLIQQLAGILPPGTLIVVVPVASTTEEPPARGTPSTPVDSEDELVALRVKEAASGPRTLAEWGRALPGVSARELDRAHRAGALRTQVRATGAGHGALEASADAVLEYLHICCGVQQSAIPAPEWWGEVRRGPNGRIHG
jgi:hypothetical protein